jgi:chemosensory pili system protein ChpA (sensor histidine kinase/response regulator)
MQRALHTLKGSARMAGAMGLGELTHNMETRVENAIALNLTPGQLFDDLEGSYDRIGLLLERVQHPQAEVHETAALAGAGAPVVETSGATLHEPALPREEAKIHAMMRVRADVLEKLVNEAGEVAITRTRIETEMHGLKVALGELTENVARLRRELREIEIAAESQLASRMQATQVADGHFDPLEFDRFTRFQELTRMMAESVNDVSTVQQTLNKVADDTDAALAAQARLNRELQQDLMRIRMVPISSIVERLHRIVRQTSKELAKRANLDIRGVNVELDRSALERMTGPLEHLLRNAIAHGLETPEARAAQGKAVMGEITLEVRQEGNEVTLVLADDGAGLDLGRIRAKATAQGLLQPGESRSDQQVAELIFTPGLSTADTVTELAGRGVGLDVVMSEVSDLGGRIELASNPGQGTRFTIRLPLTTAVIQAVLVKVGSRTYALPSVMVEQVQQMRQDALQRAKAAGALEWAGRTYPLHHLPALLGEAGALPPAEPRRYTPVLLVRSGVEAIAVEVDEMLGNQEVVVKNIGPQLASVPGIAGATVLGTGEIVMILNPVPLAARPVSADTLVTMPHVQASAVALQPRIMVVDDSLTVRKITGRLLAREGYRVLTARDGVEALELLAESVPDVMLVDVEMPRMDGFDLTRNVRADARLKGVPIIMITSRTADKHRNYATELGVNVFLGKPYQEEELLQHIAAFVGRN